MRKDNLPFYLMILVVLAIAVFQTVSGVTYSLYYNMTFLDMTASNFTIVDLYLTGAITVDNTSCVVNPCLRSTATEASSIYYLPNWNIDTQNYSWMIKGWLKNVPTTSASPHFNMYNDANNYYQAGFSRVGSYNNKRAQNLYGGTVYNNIDIANFTASSDFKWCVMKINKMINFTFQCFSDASESSSLFDEMNISTIRINQAKVGFYSDRPATWDDVEIYKESAGGADTTPPSISMGRNIVNWTLNIVVNSSVFIEANITDASGLNDSSIKMEYYNNGSLSYVNGSILARNGNISYTNYSGSSYRWYLDEQDLIALTANIEPEIMENTTHSSYLLQGTNNYLKMEFLNVSNNKPFNIVEIMEENATGIPSQSSYYYCNSTYTTGNPGANNNCVLMYSDLNNFRIAHYHTKTGKITYHRIIPFNLNTTTGKLGSVYVTSLSYILKRGSATGENVYYISTTARQNATQLSNNNGNTWSSQSYTIDAHIHYTNPATDSFNYRVTANDTYNNQATTSWDYEIIDFDSLAPSAVTIYAPNSTTNYSTTLTISHSQATTPSGSLSYYKYDYRLANGTTYYHIGNSTHPVTTYAWDISALLNTYYQVRITAYSTIGLSSSTLSDEFYVNNPLSTTEELLTDILAQSVITNSYLNGIDEAISMIWIVMLYTLFLVAGYWFCMTGNFLAGYSLLGLNFVLDLLIVPTIYINYIKDLVDTGPEAQLIGILAPLLIVWIFVKMIVPVSMMFTRRS